MGFLSNLKKKAKWKNPRTMVIFGYPKVGKTKLMMNLPEKYMVVDFDDGASFYDGNYVTIYNLKELTMLIKELKESKEKFNVIVLDTITSLDDTIVNQMAVKMYNSEKGMEKPLDWDITSLEWGAGYAYKRAALKKIIDLFTKFADTVILVGHVADKALTGNDGQAQIKELDLAGKMKNILALKVDAIGLLYRAEPGVNKLSFIHDGGLAAGTRAEHLAGKELVISKLDEDGNLKTYWDKVFINNK